MGLDEMSWTRKMIFYIDILHGESDGLYVKFSTKTFAKINSLRASLCGSVGCTSDWRPEEVTGSTPAEPGNILLWQGWQNAGKYEYFPCWRNVPVNTGKYWSTELTTLEFIQ